MGCAMELLKQKIRACGRALNEHVLLVDSFLNHQVDVKLMREVGREFAARFADAGIDRVATIESSGIAPAAMTALELDAPLLILKKSVSSILKDDVMQTEVFSFTKNAPYQLTLKPQFVRPGERVLLIDDFLANGEAALGGGIPARSARARRSRGIASYPPRPSSRVWQSFRRRAIAWKFWPPCAAWPRA